MANKVDMDFECPQFVDFAAELETSSKDDLFFDCKDHQSPENESLLRNTPTPANEIFPTEVDEDRLLGKMTAALSIIENTPKLKMSDVKGKLFTEMKVTKFTTNFRSEVKPSLKVNTVKGPSTIGLRNRSKSIAQLNKIIMGNPYKFKGLRKRSSSLNDLRAHKKQTFPMTPMCLRRTIIKGKENKLKTTEERELEEIAKLQKQLIQHLRHNEQTLKRLKLRPKPSVISKNAHAKTENLKGHKGLHPSMERLNATEKVPRRNIHALTGAALKNEAMKINNIVKGHSAAIKPIDKGLKDNKKSKNPSVSSVAEVKEKCKSQVKKMPMTGKKPGFHSGLVFHDNVKKSTTFQPFSFDAKIRENIQNTGAEQKSEVSLSNSTLKHKVDDGKENCPYDRSQSTIQKGKTVKNMKYDIVKQLASNRKIVEKHVTNPIRGLPLSENFARK